MVEDFFLLEYARRIAMQCAKVGAIFAVLKNPQRLRILMALCEQEMTVRQLEEATGLQQSALSHHLSRMRDVGLVTMRKDGSHHWFSFRKEYSCYLQSFSEQTELLYVWNMKTGEQQWYGDVDGAFGFAPGSFPRTVEAWEERVHPEDYPRVVAAARRHLEQGTPFVQQYRVRKKDGRYVTWHDSGSAVVDESRQPYKWVGMTRELR